MRRGNELFAADGAAAARVSSFGAAAPASMLVHALALSLLLLAPLWTTPTPPRLERDYRSVLLYDPPPPPPPPQSFGREEVHRRATVQVQPQRPTPSVTTAPQAATLEPATIEPDPVTESAGSPTGSATGLTDGMDFGEPGGEVGGVPGGVRDGIVGGTGHLPVPVMRVDHTPRLLRMVHPEYPPEAFVKKIEGVVIVELLVDAGGRVVRTQVTQSVPPLDAAAVDAVRQWVFSPAIKDGRPVATLATAPVTFKIH